jgi:hypothetical protein
MPVMIAGWRLGLWRMVGDGRLNLRVQSRRDKAAAVKVIGKLEADLDFDPSNYGVIMRGAGDRLPAAGRRPGNDE